VSHVITHRRNQCHRRIEIITSVERRRKGSPQAWEEVYGIGTLTALAIGGPCSIKKPFPNPTIARLTC
jgi:hypothetical protein